MITVVQSVLIVDEVLPGWFYLNMGWTFWCILWIGGNQRPVTVSCSSNMCFLWCFRGYNNEHIWSHHEPWWDANTPWY